MKLADLETRYVCDGDSSHTFLGKDVHTEELAPNISMRPPMGMAILILRPNGTIGGSNIPQAPDRLMGCPICKRIHLFGFNRAPTTL